jgi:STE24 endopeptidase
VISRFKKWWLGFTIAAIPLMVAAMILIPVYIQPMFNTFGPLQDKNLETKLLDLAGKAGIEGSNVFEVDASRQSEKINAYVTGMFNTKRIVLYDTLVKNFTTDEILFVMGHEMGHYVMNHIWLGLGLGVLFLLLSLWLVNRMVHGFIHRNQRRFRFDRLEDFASLPLILLLITVISFVGQPITNGASRSMEHQADIYGMRITGVNGEVAAQAFDKLSVFNLSDPDPSPLVEFWFYSHPSLKKRMEFVQTFHP